MNMEEKVKFFEKELDGRIKDFAKKRNRDKARAFGLKITTVMFAALITILLGIKVDASIAKILQNIALMLGAVVSVVSAMDAFFDHRSLWIRRTVTLVRLYDLERDFNFYITGLDKDKIDPKVFNKMVERYDKILANDLKAWLKMREDDNANEPDKKDAAKT
jgi:hypothetical protein